MKTKTTKAKKVQTTTYIGRNFNGQPGLFGETESYSYYRYFLRVKTWLPFDSKPF